MDFRHIQSCSDRLLTVDLESRFTPLQPTTTHQLRANVHGTLLSSFRLELGNLGSGLANLRCARHQNAPRCIVCTDLNDLLLDRDK